MASILPPRVRKQAGLLATIAAILFMTVTSVYAAPNTGVAKSLVTVYADNSERVITTTVVTVGEALERAGIELGEHDLVEPGLDTFINNADFRINVYRARPITIVDGATQKSIMSPYQSPRLIAEAAGIKVYDEDLFTFELIDDILQTGAIGQRLTIERATPVKINFYGDQFVHRTHSNTVGEVLAEAGITVGEDDYLDQSKNTTLKPNMTVNIVRVGSDIVVTEESVAYETEFIYDNNRFAGEEVIQKPGQNGIDIVTYKVELNNGVEVSRTESQRVTKTEPVTEVKIVGTKVADINSNASIGQAMAAERGWTGAEWQCLYSLWMKESGWNHLAANGSSGAYGIPQALPGSKMATAGADWATNPATQIAWGFSYIEGRYGTPCGAWSFFLSNNWY